VTSVFRVFPDKIEFNPSYEREVLERRCGKGRNPSRLVFFLTGFTGFWGKKQGAGTDTDKKKNIDLAYGELDVHLSWFYNNPFSAFFAVYNEFDSKFLLC